MSNIKFWKETDVTITPGMTSTINLDPRTNIVQFVNRKDGGGGSLYVDQRPSVSSGSYGVKVEQGKTGNLVRPYPLQRVYAATDAGAAIQVTMIEVETDELSVVYNASQVLQIQGSVAVVQPVSIDDLNTEAADGAVNPAKGFMVGGTDGTNFHEFRTDANGNQLMSLTGSKVTEGIANFVLNQQGTLLASAARTSFLSSPTQTNYNARGVIITVTVTAISGTSPTLAIQICDANLSPYDTGSTNITATGTYKYVLYPGAATAPGNSIGNKQLPLMRQWTVYFNISGTTPSITFSATYDYIL